MGFLKSKLFRFIASLGLAALFYFLCPPCFSKMYLGCVLALLVLIINLNTFFGRFRWLTHITRFLVGGLFIFSGFIKANDPIGFSIKLEEYFEVFGQGFSCDMHIEKAAEKGIPCSCESKNTNENAAIVKAPESSIKPFYDFFGRHALVLAIIICAIEIILGIFLLLGVQVRWTMFLLLAMIVFFAFLTFYSACCNKVTSCGCFGDFIKLTPWESFWKDLILLILIAILFVGEQNIQPLFKNRIVLAGVAAIGIFFSFAFPVYTYRHLPVFDFRPFKIGTNLWDASHQKDRVKTGCVTDSSYYVYYYKNKKTQAVFHCHDLDSLPSDSIWSTKWEFCCRTEKKIRVGTCGATIMDFNLEDLESGESLNDSLLHYKGIQFMLIMEDISKTDKSVFPKVNDFYTACQKAKTPFNGLSNASYEQVDTFRVQTGSKYPMLLVDGTTLKTAIRSNPGLIMIKDGVVTAMWHANDFPVYAEVMEKYKK